MTLTRADVAWLVGMSDSWVRDRMQAGDFPRPGETAEQYVEAFLEFKLRKFERADEDGRLDLEAERARLAKEQADRVAMDNAERRKELAPRPDMIAAITGVIVMAVARLQQVGAQVAQGDVKLRKRIETAINDVLTDISVTRVEEAVGGGLDEDDAPDEDDD
ncbi:hypothetical protein [Sphingobium chungbukense]|uniref:Terminase n=1 Tax=Sphingobium chungbukense TaxID=56193 RepID=A0A0M3AV77_9SPHN|nr:hypothetical protein [Sphingobium chungbukense]KKW92469.1 terminase [Sphingobium chungbukense]